MRQSTQNGFTLIELLIVIAIVGVLGGIAYPSYQDSMTKSRRADAKAALLELSVFMERLYAATGCYNPGADKNCTGGNTDAAIPALSPYLRSGETVAVTPKSGKANYNLTVDVTTPAALVNGVSSSFTLTAAPIRSTDDVKCGSLTLNNTNTKSTSTAAVLSSPNKEALIAECW